MSRGPRNFIPAASALESILKNVAVLGTVTLSLRRAEGRRLARAVTADRDVPPFDTTAMDGYAVRSADVAIAPALLAIAGETAAGDPPAEALAAGTARSVMTGAPVPPGSDAVAQFEITEPGDGARVRILSVVKPGTNMRRRGGDVAKGSVPLEAGRQIRPYEQGVLSSLGIQFVQVRRTPAALVVPTGDELVAPGYALSAGRIHESVTPVVSGLLRAEGCEVRIAPIVPDDPAAISAAVTPPAGIDLVITTGGVSAGHYDELPSALAAAGFSTIFHGVNIRPGRPLLFGKRGAVPVFALPGNPVSAAVTFLEFVRPAIRKMAGDPDPERRSLLRARLSVPVTKSDGKRHYLRGVVETAGDPPAVRPAGLQESNIASVLAGANCLILLGEEGREWPAGSMVEVELL